MGRDDPHVSHAAPAVKSLCFEDECTSFDIALEVGKKIERLQVAECQASSDEDKRLVSTHGSGHQTILLGASI